MFIAFYKQNFTVLIFVIQKRVLLIGLIFWLAFHDVANIDFLKFSNGDSGL